MLVLAVSSCSGESQERPAPAPDVTVSLPSTSVLTAQEALDATKAALASPDAEVVELPEPIPASVFEINEAEPIASDPEWIEARRVLSELSELAGSNGWRVIVEGFTDNLGSFEHNMDLSMRRAEAVRQLMITEMGYDANSVVAIGNGPVGESISNRKVTITFRREG